MKRLLKKMARPFWRMSAPVRRPLIRKFDHHMNRLLAPFSLRSEMLAYLELTSSCVADEVARLQDSPAKLDLALNRIAHEVARLQASPANLDLALNHIAHEVARLRTSPADLELVLNSAVRELARLQVQVEALQQQIDELQSSGRDGARAESRLSLVAEIG